MDLSARGDRLTRPRNPPVRSMRWLAFVSSSRIATWTISKSDSDAEPFWFHRSRRSRTVLAPPCCDPEVTVMYFSISALPAGRADIVCLSWQSPVSGDIQQGWSGRRLDQPSMSARIFASCRSLFPVRPLLILERLQLTFSLSFPRLIVVFLAV